MTGVWLYGWLVLVGLFVLLAACITWDSQVAAKGIRRRHRRYLAGLQRAAIRDADLIRALSALTPADRAWLSTSGWREPAHAMFVRVNGLDVDALPVSI